ncbi:hydrogenase nickel incorporation protein HypB [Endozoicomonas sp. SM1973]|uniref:Hydrogenase maturation factor HypB n=1 Tax=Spartinivicinus marinus TaxID=2994442 RepID=A0A853I2Y4_9GAMM|nr:hydrogenase nickel incorporation protein HypB [Spartinivicinus marinus]MCX4029660.1 hydrogenase nickel incorporation protein HypB [Spartinivicinus marinus]NYZ66959.1 hydrogenase nickel incorporation protein HypB [Spartinivicinus marinus]
MCNHCGCSSEKALLTAPGTDSQHHHLHFDAHSLQLQQSLLAGNEAIAEQNRQWLVNQNITCINLMGTPGAGKTQLLEATLADLAEGLPEVAVLEGDQQTLNDARRIQAMGGKALQINTGTGCHLDAEMIKAGLAALSPVAGSLVFIENVGNLVCPALFDLGEQRRVAMMAVTDGDDKPEKYPHLFSSCELVIINKADLLPYLEFDLTKVKQAISQLNPQAEIFLLSAKTGEGFVDWEHWLTTSKAVSQATASATHQPHG